MNIAYNMKFIGVRNVVQDDPGRVVLSAVIGASFVHFGTVVSLTSLVRPGSVIRSVVVVVVLSVQGRDSQRENDQKQRAQGQFHKEKFSGLSQLSRKGTSFRFIILVVLRVFSSLRPWICAARFIIRGMRRGRRCQVGLRSKARPSPAVLCRPEQ